MPLLETTGGPLEYVVIDGRTDLDPLVFLHHGVGSIAGWFRLHAAVAAATGRRTLAYTRHGYGASGPAQLPRPADYLHREACEILPEVLDRLNFTRPVLVGHSDGAAIAVLHATCGPRPVAGLALLAPLIYVEEHTLNGIHAVGHEFEHGDLRWKLATIHEDPDTAFHGWRDAWLSPEFRNFSVVDHLGEIREPVMVLHGSADEFATAAQADAIQSGVAGPVTRVDVPGANHQPHMTHWDETEKAVVEFLSSAALQAAPGGVAAHLPAGPR
jgi:pimeloyl-ACP methyl ester carboxylesterase